MTDSTGTGAPGGDADASKPGAVPPGESKGEEGKTPGDDWVKKSQMIAALNNISTRLDAVTRENAELKAVQAKAANPPPKEVTRAELKRLVEGGDITQDQSDALWDQQERKRQDQLVVAKVGETLNAQERERRIDTDLASYRQLKGEAWVEGTPERAKAEQAYQYHVNVLGHSPGKQTELAALHAAFGDIATLQASQSARPGSSETHSETGGGKPAGGGGEKDPLKSLTSREKSYYEDKIRAGVYPDWNAVREERQHARPRAKP